MVAINFFANKCLGSSTRYEDKELLNVILDAAKKVQPERVESSLGESMGQSTGSAGLAFDLNAYLNGDLFLSHVLDIDFTNL